MHRPFAPRWIFAVLLLVGWAVHVWGFSGVRWVEGMTPEFVNALAVFLSFYLFPYQLFFPAAGPSADRLIGEGAVLLAGLALYALVSWLAPVRLAWRHIGLVLLAWGAISMLWLGGVILIASVA